MSAGSHPKTIVISGATGRLLKDSLRGKAAAFTRGGSLSISRDQRLFLQKRPASSTSATCGYQPTVLQVIVGSFPRRDRAVACPIEFRLVCSTTGLRDSAFPCYRHKFLPLCARGVGRAARLGYDPSGGSGNLFWR
jgi:hypothetical protein